MKYIWMLLLLLSCSPPEQTAGPSKSPGKTNPDGTPKPEGGGITIGTEESTPGVASEVEELSGASFQVKSLGLLKASVASCIGPNLTFIKQDMLFSLVSNQAKIDGKIRFLPEGQYGVNDDIVDKMADKLVDITSSSRTSTAADGLTVGYLSAMQIVADVVAHNCEDNNFRCACGTKLQAKSMVARCFPYMDTEGQTFEKAVNDLLGTCSKDDIDGVPGYRVAVASIIASMAFAAAR